MLFPWSGEDEYQYHLLYKSINKVNIGGLPFLPQATGLVEQFVERLIENNPEELQREGILPIGTREEGESSLIDKVLVGTVSKEEDYRRFIYNDYFQITVRKLGKGWQEAKYVALYTTADVEGINGIKEFGKIDRVSTEDGNVFSMFKPGSRRKMSSNLLNMELPLI